MPDEETHDVELHIIAINTRINLNVSDKIPEGGAFRLKEDFPKPDLTLPEELGSHFKEDSLKYKFH